MKVPKELRRQKLKGESGCVLLFQNIIISKAISWFFVECLASVLDYVWLVRLCFEKSRTIEMILWIQFSGYV